MACGCRAAFERRIVRAMLELPTKCDATATEICRAVSRYARQERGPRKVDWRVARTIFCQI